MKPDMNSIPGGWEPNLKIHFNKNVVSEKLAIRNIPKGSQAFVLDNVLQAPDVKTLIKIFESAPKKDAVSIQGRRDIPDERIGSVRTTMWWPQMATALWSLIKNFFEERTMTEFTATDWWQHGKLTQWEPIGLTEMMRFMKYTEHGQHYAHYDAAYIYPNRNYRTLMSFVLYLSTHENSGATRFIEDGQNEKPIWERDNEDWVRPVRDNEVLARVNPIAGNILVFDHRLCHDVEELLGKDTRYIVRGDVLFRAKD